jgi:Fe2+ transport system protein FeoA
MLKRWFGRRSKTQGATSAGCASCPLAACARGCRAAVLQMDCEGDEAGRLRNLGLYEGACVTVLDSQDGLLLDVRGSRLAVAQALASTITVLPLRA